VNESLRNYNTTLLAFNLNTTNKATCYFRVYRNAEVDTNNNETVLHTFNIVYVKDSLGGYNDIVPTGNTNFDFTNSATQAVGVLDMMITPFLLFLMGIILILIGEYLASYIFTLFGGVWFLGTATTIGITEFASGFNASDLSSFTFFFLLAIATIWHALFRITENKKKKQEKYLED
jgi:hypothetical protein